MKNHITKNFPDIPSDFISVGYISGVFGVRGEVKVYLNNPQTDLFDITSLFYLMNERGKVVESKLSIRSGAGKKIIGKIGGVLSRNTAEEIVGSQILFPKDLLPDLQDDEWYHHQLLGLPVRTESGEDLGVIVEIVTGNVDVFVCENEEIRIFIPNVKAEIISLDLKTGVVVPDFHESEH